MAGQGFQHPSHVPDSGDTLAKRVDDRGTSDRSDASFSGADWVMISAAGERAAEMRDMDDESFKGISQRRNRTVGIPVVISRTAAGMDLRQVNLISLYSAVKSIIGHAPVRSRLTSQGTLLLDVATE